MAWTSPKTWSVGELVTAAMLNTHLRDNLITLWKGSAAGDMEYYSGAAAKVRLPIGASGQVLTAASGAPAWGYPAAPLIGYDEIYSEFSTSSAAFVDVTGLTLTLNMPRAGFIVALAAGTFRPTVLYSAVSARLVVDGTANANVYATKSCNDGTTDVSWAPFSNIYFKNVAAGERIVKLQLANTGAGAGTVALQEANIIALGFAGS